MADLYDKMLPNVAHDLGPNTRCIKQEPPEAYSDREFTRCHGNGIDASMKNNSIATDRYGIFSSTEFKLECEEEDGVGNIREQSMVQSQSAESDLIEKPFKCSMCPKSFPRKHFFDIHMRTHTGERPHECSVCHMVFKESSKLTAHMRKHTGEKPYSCSVCQKSFGYASALHNHMKIHDEKKYTCDVCQKAFATVTALYTHTALHGGDDKNLLKCSFCEKTFRYMHSIKTHMRTHTGERPFECSVCHKSFKQPNTLKSHMRIHTGERPYSCKMCHKTFAQVSTLNCHMKTHTGEKYSCSACPKEFSSRSALQSHSVVHRSDDEKVHKCSACEIVFKYPSQLKTHMKIHTGPEPHVNSVCLESLTDTRSLSRPNETDAGELNTSGVPEEVSPVSLNNHHVTDRNVPKVYDTSMDTNALKLSDRGDTTVGTLIVEKPYECTVRQMVFPGFNASGSCVSQQSEQRQNTCRLCENSFTQDSMLSSGGHESDICGACQNGVAKYTETPATMVPDPFIVRQGETVVNNHEVIDLRIQKPYDLSFNASDSHASNQSEQRQNTCRMCAKPFSQDSNRVFGHADDICAACQKTGVVSTRAAEFSDVDERPYKCSSCPKSFRRIDHVTDHMRTHTGERPYKCSDCPMSFKTSATLKSHRRLHSGEKPYSCTVCQKSFAQSGSLYTHMRTHSGAKPHKCDICQKSFAAASSLYTHLATHGGNDERFLQCEVCQKKFTNMYQLKTHRRTHTGERPFGCTVCHMLFKQPGALKTHMRIHTGERPYSCKVCHKTFAQTSTLHSHMRSHTGERPHECSVCHKSFSQSSQLNCHMRIHTGERPYKCSVCEKSFAYTGNLTCHMRIHTGEKYPCGECDKVFSSRKTLDAHSVIHTNKDDDSLLKCEVCEKSFRYGHALKSHMRTHTKSFAMKSTLREHMKTHTEHSEQEQHSCKICQKSFAQDSTSMLFSSGDENDICGGCQKTGVAELSKTQVEMEPNSSDVTREDLSTTSSPSNHQVVDRSVQRTIDSRIDSSEDRTALPSGGLADVGSSSTEKLNQCSVRRMVFPSFDASSTHVSQHSVQSRNTCRVCENSFTQDGISTIPGNGHESDICGACQNGVFKHKETLVKIEPDTFGVHQGEIASPTVMNNHEAIDNGIGTASVEKPYVRPVQQMVVPGSVTQITFGAREGEIPLTFRPTMNGHEAIGNDVQKPYDLSMKTAVFTNGGHGDAVEGQFSVEKPHGCSVQRMVFSLSDTRSANNIGAESVFESPRDEIRISENEKLYKCTWCPKSFTQKKILNAHWKTHGEKPHKCSVCQMCFKDSSKLTAHMRKHTGERPYTCSVCQKTFAYTSTLYCHMRSHAGSRFTCDVCQKSFSSPGGLRRHSATHGGDDSLLECGVCRKKFKYKSDLTIHMRTHTGERPFACSVCHRLFKQSNALAEHMRRHTGERPFPCRFCPMTFATSSTRNTHIKKLHAEENV